MSKEYAIQIDQEQNIKIKFDEECNYTYGDPVSVTSSTSVALKEGKDGKNPQLIKTTTIKEAYQLKEKKIQKEDILFALQLIEQQRTFLDMELLFADKALTPGTKSNILVTKIKDKDLFKLIVDIEYDTYYEGELKSKKVKEKAAFVVNKEQVIKIYNEMTKATKAKEAITLLQALKQIFKDLIIPTECESIKEGPDKHPVKQVEHDRNED